MEKLFEFDDFELEEENLWETRCKTKRHHATRRSKGRNKTKRLVRKLLNQRVYRPSIWAKYDWDLPYIEALKIARVKREKRSSFQKRMKKHSNRVYRRVDEKEIVKKGNSYRKQYDYWWNWY